MNFRYFAKTLRKIDKYCVNQYVLLDFLNCTLFLDIFLANLTSLTRLLFVITCCFNQIFSNGLLVLKGKRLNWHIFR